MYQFQLAAGLVAHEGNVARVMEELVDGTKNGGGTDGRAMDGRVDVAHEVKNHRAQHEPGRIYWDCPDVA